MGRELKIDTVFAEVLPGDKAAKIEEVRRSGKRVAMVGDGVNDAPALVTADVGIAIGAGTDVAVEAGDVILVRSDPRDVPRIIALSRATYRKMVQNLWWAAGYNVVAIPLAAGVLARWGVLLHPAAGAVLDVGEHGHRGAQCPAVAKGKDLDPDVVRLRYHEPSIGRADCGVEAITERRVRLVICA